MNVFKDEVSLSVNDSTHLEINPDNNEAKYLRSWLKTHKIQVPCLEHKYTLTLNFTELNEEHKRKQNDESIIFENNFFIIDIDKEIFAYNGCKICKKRLIENKENKYFCRKCNKVFHSYESRAILRLRLADKDGTISGWVTCFQEQIQSLFKIGAKILQKLKENNKILYNSILEKCEAKEYYMKLKAIYSKKKKEDANSTLKLYLMNVFDIKKPDIMSRSKTAGNILSGEVENTTSLMKSTSLNNIDET